MSLTMLRERGSVGCVCALVQEQLRITDVVHIDLFHPLQGAWPFLSMSTQTIKNLKNSLNHPSQTTITHHQSIIKQSQTHQELPGSNTKMDISKYLTPASKATWATACQTSLVFMAGCWGGLLAPPPEAMLYKLSNSVSKRVKHPSVKHLENVLGGLLLPYYKLTSWPMH